MTFLNDERGAAQSEGSNTASPHCVGRDDAQETTQHAFSAKPKASLAASALRLLPE